MRCDQARWRELDPRVRQAILLGGAFEAGLKIAALNDLAQRPPRDIRGSKTAWAVGLVVLTRGDGTGQLLPGGERRSEAE